ncbi:hypothetical protein [Streptomyces sp. WM6386]|uniref:hypothetical protein n=1 Tax=Streptomyces sp. WM6386 TaxID=1415558 RepID=UPI000BA2A901|nr:hypothetical protein [Streptomyces sp. WM6386]
MGAGEALEDRWSEWLWVDYLAAAVIVAGHILLIRLTGSGDWLSWIDSSQRTDAYGTSAGVVSAIGGLSAIAISIYTASNGIRVREVRREHHAKLRKSWRALLAVTALCCALFIVAQTLDRKNDPLSARFIFEYAFCLAVIRFGRLIWLFEMMMRISDRDLTDPQIEPAPVRDPDWVQRRRQNAS